MVLALETLSVGLEHRQSVVFPFKYLSFISDLNTTSGEVPLPGDHNCGGGWWCSIIQLYGVLHVGVGIDQIGKP